MFKENEEVVAFLTLPVTGRLIANVGRIVGPVLGRGRPTWRVAIGVNHWVVAEDKITKLGELAL
jgi:hypothetical protein